MIEAKPIVGVIMGSDSDLKVMIGASEVLTEFEVPHEVRVISAHRTPKQMMSYAMEAGQRGLQLIIAGAGGAAHLPGMTAAYTTLPVIGVPVTSRALAGVDSVHSILQMPPGVPVATVAIDGARNAGLLAVRILAINSSSLRARLERSVSDPELKVIQTDESVKRDPKRHLEGLMKKS